MKKKCAEAHTFASVYDVIMIISPFLVHLVQQTSLFVSFNTSNGTTVIKADLVAVVAVRQ